MRLFSDAKTAHLLAWIGSVFLPPKTAHLFHTFRLIASFKKDAGNSPFKDAPFSQGQFGASFVKMAEIRGGP